MQPSHQSVMLNETVDALNVQADGCYVDATFGRGGHTRAILQRLGPNGRVLVIDKDPQAIAVAKQWAATDPRILVCQGSFNQLADFCASHGIQQAVTGVLFDLGVSSPQLDQPERGFSFQQDGPLDMRMDTTQGETAAEWLTRVSEQELSQVLRTFGEERFARRIARKIVASRQQAPLKRTGQLAALIRSAIPVKPGPQKHPATRSFQAIRIQINRELDDLTEALKQGLACLAHQGRLVVISFHSLEDRIVKRFIQTAACGDPFPAKLPVPVAWLQPTLRKIGKARQASAGEVAGNQRARSAVMRVAEKITGQEQT